MSDIANKDYCLEGMDIAYENAYYSVTTSYIYSWNAYTALWAGDLFSAVYFTLVTLGYVQSAAEYLCTRNYLGDIEFFTVPYFLRKYVICGWKGIIEAWIKNDFEARTWTIATIDRMRQILWNEPFDVRWAARPELGAFI